MAQKIITGFHAIQERLLNTQDSKKMHSMTIFYSKIGPRVKKIIEIAKKSNILLKNVDEKSLDNLVKNLPQTSQDHRGIVLAVEDDTKKDNLVNFDQWILQSAQKSPDERQTVLILDSVTDPHNIGAIIRSCDQFGVSLVILPNHNALSDIKNNEVIARSSAGSISWVSCSIVTNLVRTTQILKENGFWVYGADARGETLESINFPKKTVIIMGSEGNGIARLLQEQCDSITSIPTCGKIDSLNVSVAAGVILYEIYKQTRGTL